MPADRDRYSYEPEQQYRSVVAQQGRVIVPADFTEAQEIFGEELREETLDVIGPTGTPDNGYEIGPPTVAGSFDFHIREGTMYLGGLRVVLADDIAYSEQTDWLNPPMPNRPAREFVYLLVTEREIAATEDSALRDVAIGGPDTTQRTRMVKRIVRTGVDAATCAAALAIQIQRWESEGLIFDPTWTQLHSDARLQVSFVTAGGPADPCEPSATGGYLGAENQLLRVKVLAPQSDGGPLRLLWGFDDASYFYRVNAPDDQTLELSTPPPDTFHFPRVGQAVEVLRTEGQLSNDEYFAHDGGQVFTLDTAYDPDFRTVELPSALPPDFIPPNGTQRLFLRVWEQVLEFTPGSAVTLGNTGVRVTLTSTSDFPAGDFWAFALRPATPVEVYPTRYLDAPQPPKGLRRWATPLAVITWGVGAVGQPDIDDCRRHFNTLVDPINVQDEGVTIVTTNTLNFIGAGVTVTEEAGRANITIPGRGNDCCGESNPTRLLFPFVTNQAGFDTGIFVANTSRRPRSNGSVEPGQGGVCAIHFFGCGPTGGPASPGTQSILINPGEHIRFTLSAGGGIGPCFPQRGPIRAVPEFQGYMVIVCPFSGAHGYAQIGDIGFQRVSSSYLAVNLCELPLPPGGAISLVDGGNGPIV
jgi:hypothetical protein